MPQHKGFEPFARIWVVQVSISFKPACFDGSLCSKTYACTQNVLNVFVTQSGYETFKAWLPTQTTGAARIIRMVTDYGEQKWWNDKVWMQSQFNDMYLYGNFSPTLRP